MSTADIVVRSRRVVTQNGIRPAAVHVHEGRIEGVTAHADVPVGALVRDAGDLIVMPGLVDTHVHVNEPGRTDWEGFETATRAAAAGGVTTIIDMPLNSVPPTTSAAALKEKRAAAQGHTAVNVGFWGGVVPGNVADLPALCDAGVRGFKCFLVPSGVDEFPAVTEADLRSALPVLAERDLPLLLHAELPASIERATAAAARANPKAYATWLGSRPVQAELEAIALVIRLAREFGARMHVVHVSAAEAVPLLRRARSEGLRVTAETCPHYLTFAAEDIAAGATEFKCAPPLRDRANRDRLWEALIAGDLQLIASDHSPCPPGLKALRAGDFMRAWGGIAGLELTLSAVWTGLSSRGGDVERLCEWLSAAPAQLAGFGGRKGEIAAGADADLVIWDPNASVVVDGDRLHHRHKLTPYHGMTLRGRVDATLIRGHLVHERGMVDNAHGRLH
jgi:allantoinase